MKSNEQIDQETWSLIRKVASNLKTHRKLNGLTQNDMTKHGFGARWYQRLESGRHIPTIPTLNRLARTFKVDISDLFK